MGSPQVFSVLSQVPVSMTGAEMPSFAEKWV